MMISLHKLNTPFLSICIFLNVAAIGLSFLGTQNLVAAKRPRSAQNTRFAMQPVLTEEKKQLVLNLLRKKTEYLDLQIESLKKANKPAPSLFNKYAMSIISPKELVTLLILISLVGADTIMGYNWGPRLIHIVTLYSCEIYGHYAAQIQAAALAGGTLGYFHGLWTTITTNGLTGILGSTLSLGYNTGSKVLDILSKVKLI
jgi:hypothetical protein